MYPLNVNNPAIGGYAVANDAAEHAALTEAGYLPAIELAETSEAQTVESVRAKLDAAGIAYDGRMGLKKLQELLPQ